MKMTTDGKISEMKRKGKDNGKKEAQEERTFLLKVGPPLNQNKISVVHGSLQL